MGHAGSALVAFAVGLACCGRPGLAADAAAILHKATTKVLATVDRVPDYTCVQTVERRYYHPLANHPPRACSVVLDERQHPTPAQQLQLHSIDRLRLDVALTKAGEIFSWVGASRFEEGTIDRLVRRGPFGTGAFGGFLDAIFRQDVKSFRVEGLQTWNGRSVMVYSFQVPAEASHYDFLVDRKWAPTAYAGTFSVNPETGSIVRMRFATAILPEAAGMCQSSVTLEFGEVPIGNEPFVLPTHSWQMFIEADGEEIENTTEFAGCREYRGESTIKYGETGPVPVESTARQTAPQAAMDLGLKFTLELIDAIDTRTAAAGDRFSARLVHDLRDLKGRVVARGGSVVDGRLRRVETLVQQHEVVVVLAPAAVIAGGNRLPLSASLDWSYLQQEYKSTGQRGGLEVLMPAVGERPAGVFLLMSPQTVMRAGSRSEWRTAEPAQ